MKPAKKIRSPLSKGAAKVPVVMQMEALECGAASLAMILAYYEKWIPLEQVRLDCGVSRDGSNARNILRAARSYGLSAKGYRYEPDELKKEGKFPCIIHWNFNHFVVLDGFRGNKAVINDPAKGTYTVPMNTFDDSFTGVCLFFEPGENFVPEGKPQSMLSFAKKRLVGAVSAVGRGKRTVQIHIDLFDVSADQLAHQPSEPGGTRRVGTGRADHDRTHNVKKSQETFPLSFSLSYLSSLSHFPLFRNVSGKEVEKK